MIVIARIGSFLSGFVIVVTLFEYVTRPQWMLRWITPWMHQNDIHLLPSTVWLAFVAYFGLLGIILGVGSNSLSEWVEGRSPPPTLPRPLHRCAMCDDSPATKSPVQKISEFELALFTMAREMRHNRHAPSGASLNHPPPERYISSMNTPKWLLNLEISGLGGILTFLENDKAAAIQRLKDAEVKVGDLVVQFGTQILQSKFSGNPLIALFLPEIAQGLQSEVGILEGEAGGEDEVLFEMLYAAVKAEHDALVTQANTPSSSEPAPATSAVAEPAVLLTSSVAEEVELERS